ncbi:MAG TPA: substrate-binding domain-containing protein [Kribbella sp.]|jgi:ABC-type sugar transport system substrate-binding protein
MGKAQRLRRGAAAVLLVLAASACNGTGGSSSGDAGAAVAATAVMPADQNGAPYQAAFPWGTFKLAPRIVDKVKAHQPLNFVYSISDAGQPVFSAAIQSGFNDGVAKAAKAAGYPLKARMIGPVGGGNQKQIAEIQQLLNSNQIDVLVFNAAQPGPFIDVLNQVMAAGVPVWGTGGDSPQSHRIGFFALDEEAAGKQAGQLAAQWAKQHGLPVRKAAVFTGDPSGPWAQSRMQGFIAGVHSVLPSVQFVNGVSNPLNTGFDFPKVYSETKSFILGHSDVQLLFHTDQGVQMVGKAIADTGRTGKTWAVGFNLSPEILNSMKSSQILVTEGQNWHGQAAMAATAGADFLFKGKVLKGFQPATPYPVTPATLDDALKTLKAGGA